MSPTIRKLRRLLFFAITVCLATVPGQPLRAGTSLQQYLEAMGYVAVSFDSFDSSGYFRLDATVNGRAVRFMIDTGATFTVLDTGNATGIKTLGELNQKLKDSEGRVMSDPNILLIEELKLGSVRFSHQPAFRRDLDIDRIHTGFGGLLGMDFIYRNCCLVDCGDQKLYLRGSRLSPAQLDSLKQTFAGTGFAAVPLRRGRRLQVNSKVNGQPLAWMIDTGSRYTVIDSFGEEHLGLHPVTEPRAGTNIPQPKEGMLRGIKGPGGLGNQKFHVLKLHQLEIGQRTWKDLYMVSSDIRISGDHPIGNEADLHGILGEELLTNDGAILDPRDGIMWFRHAAPDRY